jgi:drug/metabolite transporter (DMT)-like permease
LVKPLIEKYNIITLLKWLFLLAVFLNLPVTFNEFVSVKWADLPIKDAVLPMLFVVVGTTFCTYLFNAYALRTLSPSTVSSFIYLQPIVGIVYAVSTKSDTLSLVSVTGNDINFYWDLFSDKKKGYFK